MTGGTNDKMKSQIISAWGGIFGPFLQAKVRCVRQECFRQEFKIFFNLSRQPAPVSPAWPNGSFERPLEPKGGQLKTPDVILCRGFLSPHNVCISGSGHRRLNPAPQACCKSSSPICSLLQLIVSPSPRLRGPTKEPLPPGWRWQCAAQNGNLRFRTILCAIVRWGVQCWPGWPAGCRAHLPPPDQPTAPPFPRSFNHPSFAPRRKDFRPPDSSSPQLPHFPGSGL